MKAVVSMLRGVNLAKHRRIKMDELRAVYESLELRQPTTFIQSGNVIFLTAERDLARLARRIEDAIEERFGFRPDVVVRTIAELKDAIARNPFAGRKGIEPGKLIVTFLGGEPAAEARDKIRSMKTDPEELRIDGRELYIYYPDGQGRTKLPMAAIERTLKTPGTGRNWNSVTKMLEIAAELEAGHR